MVKIIDGEVLQDDDPRIQELLAARARRTDQTQQPRNQGNAQGPPRPGAPAAPGGFQLDAPPLRFIPPEPGSQPLFGLPDAEVFGIRLPMYMLLGIAFVLVSFGWRGAVALAVVLYIYQSNQAQGGAGPQGRARQGQQQGGGRGGGLPDMFQQVMGGAAGAGGGGGAAGSRPGAPRSGAPPAAGVAGQPGPGGDNKGAFSGKAYKLGG